MTLRSNLRAFIFKNIFQGGYPNSPSCCKFTHTTFTQPPTPNLKYLPTPLITHIVTTLLQNILSMSYKHNFVGTLTSHSSGVPVPVTSGSTTGTFSKGTLTATTANTNQKYWANAKLMSAEGNCICWYQTNKSLESHIVKVYPKKYFTLKWLVRKGHCSGAISNRRGLKCTFTRQILLCNILTATSQSSSGPLMCISHVPDEDCEIAVETLNLRGESPFKPH